MEVFEIDIVFVFIEILKIFDFLWWLGLLDMYFLDLFCICNSFFWLDFGLWIVFLFWNVDIEGICLMVLGL